MCAFDWMSEFIIPYTCFKVLLILFCICSSFLCATIQKPFVCGSKMWKRNIWIDVIHHNTKATKTSTTTTTATTATTNTNLIHCYFHFLKFSSLQKKKTWKHLIMKFFGSIYFLCLWRSECIWLHTASFVLIFFFDNHYSTVKINFVLH